MTQILCSTFGWFAPLFLIAGVFSCLRLFSLVAAQLGFVLDSSNISDRGAAFRFGVVSPIHHRVELLYSIDLGVFLQICVRFLAGFVQPEPSPAGGCPRFEVRQRGGFQIRGGGVKQPCEDINNISNGNYAILYQDKQGDWMLAGDVPWETAPTTSFFTKATI